MANIPTINICKAEVIDNIRAVWVAMGLGGGFIRKCCAIDSLATPQTPPTHYLESQAGADPALVAVWQDMPNGNLPPVTDGGVWGVSGVISAEAAMFATNGTNLHVYTVSGDIAPQAHADAILAFEGLQFVPDEPL